MRQAVKASLRPIKASFKTVSIPRSSSSLARAAHFITLGLLPAIVLLLVRADITALAVTLVILTKWRTLAVRPRFWITNIRANSIDIIVGLSTVIFIIQSPSLAWQIAWTIIYAFWLIIVKPSSKAWIVSLQAVVGEAYGLIALLLAWGDAPLFVITFMTGLICYLAARHFFSVFDEAYAKLLSYLWAVFAAAIIWLLGHLLFFYGPISQPTLLLIATSFGFATLYYLEHFDKSSKLARRQVVVLTLVVLVAILVKLAPLMFYVWSDNVL